MAYPVTLTIKQRSRLLNHLLVRFLLANAGGEVLRVGMHLDSWLNGVISQSSKIASNYTIMFPLIFQYR